MELTIFLAAFLTPLLFFTGGRDQFELPKLTFLALLLPPLFLQKVLGKGRFRPLPLLLPMAVYFATAVLASLPSQSLSWSTSLLGDYENFSGLTTLALFFLWFWALSGYLEEKTIEKIFRFNSWAAILSSLYAIGQHFGFDFIQWNPQSINSAREFASLGNPNFLSAYLAMSLPLFWGLSRGNISISSPSIPSSASTWLWGAFGLFFALLGTEKTQGLFHLEASSVLGLGSKILSLLFLGVFLVRVFSRPNLWALLGGTALFLFGLFSTASRGGFLGALAGVLCWIVITRPLRQKPSTDTFSRVFKIRLQLSIPILLGFLVIFGKSFIFRLLNSIVHAGESLSVSRLHIWRPALRMVRAHPWTGVGLDNFKIAFPYYSGIEFNQIDGMFTSSRMAHNELLQIASTTGLLGLAAYLLLLFSFGNLWLKTFRRSAPQVQWILAAILSSAVAYQIQNLFSFGVAALNWLWFFLLAATQALAAGSEAPIDFAPPPAKTRFYLQLYPAVGIALALFLLAPRRLGSDIAFGYGSSISDFLKKPSPETSLEELDFYSDAEIRYFKKAVDLLPLEVKYRLYLGLANEQRAHLDRDHSRDWDLAALENYEKAAGLSRANAYYYNDEGRVAEALGQGDPKFLEAAERAYGAAVRLAPSSPLFLVNWSEVLKKNGNRTEADAALDKAFELDAGFTGKLLAQQATDLYRQGDRSGAFACLERAIRQDGSSPELYYCRGILYLSEKENRKALADFKIVQALHPSSEKNPSIQSLDILIKQAAGTSPSR